jgi:hypothetical protein
MKLISAWPWKYGGCSWLRSQQCTRIKKAFSNFPGN